MTVFWTIIIIAALIAEAPLVFGTIFIIGFIAIFIYAMKSDEISVSQKIIMVMILICSIGLGIEVCSDDDEPVRSSYSSTYSSSTKHYCMKPGCTNYKASGSNYCYTHKSSGSYSSGSGYSSSGSSYSSSYSSSSSSSHTNNYSYWEPSFDPEDYDDPEEFADDAENEFGSWDDAYDYWENY